GDVGTGRMHKLAQVREYFLRKWLRLPDVFVYAWILLSHAFSVDMPVVHTGKIDTENRSFPRTALRCDIALVILYDLFANGVADAGTRTLIPSMQALEEFVNLVRKILIETDAVILLPDMMILPVVIN